MPGKRGMAFIQHLDVLGEIPAVRCPLRFSESKTQAPLPNPALGAHTREVRSTELGLTEAGLDRLRETGVAG